MKDVRNRMNDRSRFRRRVPWIVAWGAMTIAGVLIHAATWAAPHADGAGLSSLAEFGIMKRVSNAVDTVVGPLWLALALVTGDWGVFSVFQSTIAHGLTAAILLVVLRWVWRVRRSLKASQTQTPRPPQVNLVRRRMLADLPLGAAALLGGGTVINGAFLEPFDLQLRKHTL